MTLQSGTSDLLRLRVEAETLTTTPYLITVTSDLRPHCSVAHPRWDPACGLVVAAPNTWKDAEKPCHREVTLLWPPADADGYTLIVDGTAVTEEDGSGLQLRIAPSRAVLHRPGQPSSPGSPCTSDCIQILPS